MSEREQARGEAFAPTDAQIDEAAFLAALEMTFGRPVPRAARERVARRVDERRDGGKGEG